MADRWNRVLDFVAGAAQPRPADVGPRDPSPQEPPLLGTLRIGFPGSAVIPDWTAEIQLPAQLLTVGPLDLPLVVAIELPVRVLVYPPPAGAVADTGVTVSAIPNAIGCQADGGTRAQVVLAAATVDVPQWVTGISVLSAGVSVDLLDAAAAVIDQVTGFRVPRPRQCVQVRAVGTTAILFHYTL